MELEYTLINIKKTLKHNNPIIVSIDIFDNCDYDYDIIYLDGLGIHKI